MDDKTRARENMQFKKVKKEIINCKKRDFVQTCRFYAKNRVFLQIEMLCKSQPGCTSFDKFQNLFVIFLI